MTTESVKEETAGEEAGALLPPCCGGTPAPGSDMHVTEFAQRVYDLCRQVPSGYVTTYGEMAKYLSTSPRAVGNALRKNPFAPKVPCHRVVKTDGTLGGYMGFKDVLHPMMAKKRQILEQEGVRFQEDRVDPAHIYRFSKSAPTA